MFMKTNLLFSLKLGNVIREGSVIRKLRRAYRNMFHRVNNDHIKMPCSSLKNKRQKINEILH